MNALPINLTPRAPLCFSVCVDESNAFNFKGHLYDGVNDRPHLFLSMDDFFRIMDREIDSHMYPQATVELRSFTADPARKANRGRAMTMDKQKKTQQTIIPGQKATFVVHVRCRQNATWQGSVDWLEGKNSQKFRSSLELIKLIDSALQAEEVEKPTWE